MLFKDDEDIADYVGMDIDMDDGISVIGDDDDLLEAGVITQEELEEERMTRKSNNSYTYKLPTVDDVKIPQRRIPQIMEGYDCVVVHDFGDIYHLSEEERLKVNEFYDAFKQVTRMKTKYKSIPSFIKAFRACMECLKKVADKNGIYSPEKFLKLYYRGEIEVYGLQFPRFTGREKKHINMEELFRFILSDDDPSEWNQTYAIETEGTLEERMNILFTQEELNDIFNSKTSEEVENHINTVHVNGDEMLERENVAYPLSDSELKKIDKSILTASAKDIKKNRNERTRLSTFVGDLTEDDFAKIDKYDAKHGYRTSTTIPAFKGEILSDKAYDKHMLKLDECENNSMIEYNGKLYTKEQVEEIKLKEALAAAGYNMLTIYDNKEKRKKLKAANDRDKEKARELRKRLNKIDARRKRRMGEEDSDDDSDKSSKKKKKKKKHKSEDD